MVYLTHTNRLILSSATQLVVRGASAAVAIAAVCGCLGNEGLSAGARAPTLGDFDSQACVEAALRNKPDVATLPAAFDHFHHHCGLGKSAACSSLGIMFERGLAVPRNERRAVTLYQRACTAGNVAACTNLALAYAGGIGVAKDNQRAVTLLHGSCHDGHSFACAELGDRYVVGASIPQDVRLGSHLLRQACERSDSGACSRLARLYDDGELPSDPTQAVALHARACIGGVDESCARLAAAPKTTLRASASESALTQNR